MPDGRVSRVRFETLAFFCRSSPQQLGLSAGSHTPTLPLVYRQPRSTAYDGFWPALCPAPSLTLEPPRSRAPLRFPGVAEEAETWTAS
jgi:hypothetical protein